jgi:hypothetical protein
VELTRRNMKHYRELQALVRAAHLLSLTPISVLQSVIEPRLVVSDSVLVFGPTFNQEVDLRQIGGASCWRG